MSSDCYLIRDSGHSVAKRVDGNWYYMTRDNPGKWIRDTLMDSNMYPGSSWYDDWTPATKEGVEQFIANW